MLAVALIMGAISGVLVQGMLNLLLSAFDAHLGPVATLVTFLVAWAASTHAMVHKAVSLSRVFSRGFLIGAAEWLFMILVGFIFAGSSVSRATAHGASDAASAGATIGGGIVAFMTGGVSIVMALFCLVGFAVSHHLGKEMKAEAPDRKATKKCPSCAELVQAEALKCRYCGEALEKAA